MKYFEQWYSKRANACSIDNCRAYFNWINKEFVRVHLLCKDNRKTFKKAFGTPDTYWKGSEFRFSVWIQEYEEEKFILLTAKGKGTCIEICDTDYETINHPKKSKAIMNYIELLLNKIMEADNENN